MNINEMRQFIMSQYPNSMGWHKKVSNMEQNQVIAIYYSMKERAERKKKEKKEEELRKKSGDLGAIIRHTPEPQFHQIDIWEYLASTKNRDKCVKG